MRVSASNYPYLADWLVISIRWLALLSLATLLSARSSLDTKTLLLFFAPALWNVFVSILAMLNRRLVWHRPLNVMVDGVAALLLFVFTGGINSPVYWAGILPLLTAAIYYELRGGLLVSISLCLAQAGWLYLKGQFDLANWQPMAILGGINLGAGLILGFTGHIIIRRLRKTYLNEMNARRETEQRAKRQERERIQALYHMIEILSASLNYQVVLDTALDLSATLLGEKPNNSRLICAVMLFSEHDLRMEASRRLSPSDAQRTFPAEQGALAKALKEASPQLIEKPAQDAELGQIFAMQSCASAYCLPLVRGMQVYGVMVYAHPEANYFNNERREMLEMVSHQAVIAIQNARLYEDLEREKNKIVETQEEARKKLARDLHDGPTQSISAIAMRLNIVRKMLEQRPEEVPEELARIEEFARRTTQEIRHMLFTMRPLVLETEGLIAALKVMAEKMRDTYQQNVVIDVNPAAIAPLDVTKHTVLFYIAEEAVNNARKHAKASEIRVSIQFVPQETELILLEIADNGAGFDVQAINKAYERRGSLGMVNLRERTELVNGYLNIVSAIGKGTRVRVYVPLTDEAADRLQRGLFKINGQG
jgi:signal transduction histidine kinase